MKAANPDKSWDYQREVGVELRGNAGEPSIASASAGGEAGACCCLQQVLVLYEPPYAERHVRWCERTVRELIPHFLLDWDTDEYRFSGFQLFADDHSLVRPWMNAKDVVKNVKQVKCHGRKPVGIY